MFGPHGARLAWLAWLLGVLWSTPCAALSWQAPPGCLTSEQASGRLRETVEPSASATVQVWIDRFHTGEWRARITWSDGGAHEERVLYAVDCAELGRATLLVLELALPERVVESEQADIVDAPTLHPPIKLGLRLSGMLDSGVLPSAAFGIAGSLLLERQRLLLEAGGGYFLPQNKPLAEHDVRIHLALAFALVRGCYRFSGPSRAAAGMSVSACAAAELGRARGRARDLTDSHHVQGMWGAALPGLKLSFHKWPRVRPDLMLELDVPFRRPSFDVAGVGSVFQAASAAIRLSLSVHLRGS